MIDPKTPLSAAAIFLAGIAVIAYTTLDIKRTTSLNKQPLTDQQRQALATYIQDLQDRRSPPPGVAAHKRQSFCRRSWTADMRAVCWQVKSWKP